MAERAQVSGPTTDTASRHGLAERSPAEEATYELGVAPRWLGAAPPPELNRPNLVYLQRMAGNSSVAQLLSRRVARPSQVGDPARRDRASDPTGTALLKQQDGATAEREQVSSATVGQQAGSSVVQRDAATPAIQPTVTGPAVQRDPPTPSNIAPPEGSGGQPAAPGADQGGFMSGEVEMPLPNLNILDRKVLADKNWSKQIGGAIGIDIPIPELPVATVGLHGKAEAHARFNAEYGPVQLRNIKVRMSKQQALSLGIGAASFLVMPGFAGAGIAQDLYKGPFHGSAQLYVPAGTSMSFGFSGAIGLDAALAAKLKLLELDAGVSGDVQLKLGLEPPFQDLINFTYQNGDLEFHKNFQMAANLNLELVLSAFLRLQVLGKWNKSWNWNLAKTPIDKNWPLSPVMKVDNNRGGGSPPALKPGASQVTNSIMASLGDTVVEFVLGEQDLSNADASDILKRALGKTKPEEKRELVQGKFPYPTGRRDDPIPMYWYKPLKWYLDPVKLKTGKNGEIVEYRRDRKGMLPNHQAIGVSYWPSPGDKIQIGVAQPREGFQKEFRDALAQYGFNWSGWDADHVEDLQAGASDDFDNLWPLESGVNQRAGNWQLGQSVEYSRDSEPPGEGNHYGPIAIKDNPDLRNRYFEIKDYKDP